MLTVVVTLKAWGSNFSGKKIVINCDNLVTVRVINTGASTGVDRKKLDLL
jgi:hypothetical protein